MFFCNTPDESQRGLIFANVTLLLMLSTARGLVLPVGRRAKRDNDALVPVAFEIGFVSGAVCAGVSARGFVRPRGSRARRAAFGGRDCARRRAAVGRRPQRESNWSRTARRRPLPDLHAHPSRRRIGAGRVAVVGAADRFRPIAARACRGI